MKHLFLGVAVAAFVTACGSVTNKDTPAKPTVTTQAQTKIPESFTTDMTETMRKHNLKGFSLAIFENYEVVYSQQWGVKASTTGELIDKDTAFSTASMAKPITALLSVTLEEKGLLNLDDPISGYLKRWSIPQNEFTKNTPVTWKHLLSHMSGADQFSGFSDFYEGDKIPTLLESLEGKLPRYNGVPLDFVFTPGSEWRYSGGGYTIVQMALEDHFQKPLHLLAKEYVFDPLGMERTTMVQPNEEGFITNIASVHDSKGDVIRSGIPITPQVAPSGMWSTPEDMAKLAIAMQKALLGDKDSLISQKTAEKLTDIITLKSSSGHSLFGPRSFGFANTDWLLLGGSNTGVGGEVLASMEKGKGYAFFGNGDRPNRTPVFTSARGEIIDMMGWQQTYDGVVVQDVPKTLITAITGSYSDFLYGEVPETEITNEDGKLYYVSAIFEYFIGQKKSDMIYLGDNTFKIMDHPNTLRFNLDNQNSLTSITLSRNNDPNLSETIGLDKLQFVAAK